MENGTLEWAANRAANRTAARLGTSAHIYGSGTPSLLGRFQPVTRKERAAAAALRRERNARLRARGIKRKPFGG